MNTFCVYCMHADLLCIFVADDAMDAWDQAKLEDVVDKKHGSKNKGLPPTTIVSYAKFIIITHCSYNIIFIIN